MTKKRFVNKGKDIFQYGEWWCSAGGEHCADVIAEALNILLDENEQLKADKQSLIEFIKKEFPKSHKHILEGFE